jgi:CDP-glycerol glycerophosphotransferase (TagB/SpsB family)
MGRKKLHIRFFVAYSYYFPHFLPIGECFSSHGHTVTYILSATENSATTKKIAEENHLHYEIGENHLFSHGYDVLFLANTYKNIHEIPALKIFLEHGIGTKSTSFFQAITYVDIYLVEGKQKYQRLKELYPHHEKKLAMVGFSKFDAIAQFTSKNKKEFFNTYHLDPTKKTILYAPTFFPSSIEKMPNTFPEHFSECNIIIKPHYLSYERSRYAKQRQKFQTWQAYSNCTVLPLSQYNLIPLLAMSDVMISDESSAMFEFAALNKPVISNRYFKLRWSYYLMPWKLSKRIDPSKEKYRAILDNAYTYQETLTYTKEALDTPQKLEKQRVTFSEEICGKIDGKVSQRIYEVTLKTIKEREHNAM